MLVPRAAASTLKRLAEGYPLVAITGPRQSGKTTLTREVFAEKPYVSLEDLDERRYAEEDPRGFLGRFPDSAVLDEVQRCPDLFSYLQSRVDGARYLGAARGGGVARVRRRAGGEAGRPPRDPLAAHRGACRGRMNGGTGGWRGGGGGRQQGDAARAAGLRTADRMWSGVKAGASLAGKDSSDASSTSSRS